MKKGSKHTREAKEKNRMSHLGKSTWNKNKKMVHSGSFKKGHKYFKETEKTQFKKGQNIGKDNVNWRGGSSFELYSVDWTKTLRRSIRERDHYTCQLCGKLQGDIVYSVHHIDYNKKNCNPDNLITLCRSCHVKTNYNRKYWINRFNNNYVNR